MPISIRTGDSVFVRTGEPVIVKDREDSTGIATLVRDTDTVKEATRHGYINGLSVEQRDRFNEILDQVKAETEEPEERVNKLLECLQDLEKDPRNFNLSRYVKAEMVHVMNTFGIKPKEYTVHESRIR